jgi:hypothetical protein
MNTARGTESPCGSIDRRREMPEIHASALAERRERRAIEEQRE